MTNMEQKVLDLNYKDKIQCWRDQEILLKENKSKATSCMFNYCGKAMQMHLLNIPNYEDQVKDDTIEMIKEIKKC